MAQLVKHENDLLALEVSLAVEGSGGSGDPVVVFEVQRGDRLIHRETATPAELGVPTDLTSTTWAYADPPFVLPEPLLDRLQGAVNGVRTGRDALLWLNIAIPAGFVALLPWERLLRGRFELPVVRVPNFALHPARDTDQIDVVLCVTQPAGKEPFDAAALATAFVEAFRRHVLSPTTLHVFVDAGTYPLVRDRWPGDDPETGRVLVHDPASAPPPAPGGPRYENPAYRSNPWFHWMAHELADRTVEVVHVIAHGYLSGNQPAIVLAEGPNPSDGDAAVFVDPRQLAAFLSMVGVWAVGISSPPEDYSPMGSRQFLNDLSRERAGPMIQHPFATDPTAEALGETWFSVFSGVPPAKPSDVALCCHPRLFPQTSPGDSTSFAEALVGASFGAARASAVSAPAWMTLTRRHLEQSAALLFPDTEEPEAAEAAAGRGVADAFDFISGVLAAAEPGATSTGDDATFEAPESRSSGTETAS